MNANVATGRVFVVLVGILLGVPAGLGSFTFHYAEGFSYLSNEPTVCVNCHVMRPQFASWIKSSHRTAAVCNDCHSPSGVAGKYASKAINGLFHSWAFITGNFKEPIEIKPHNRQIVENSCKDCHAQFLSSSSLPQHQPGRASCLNCHSDVGHVK